MTITFVFTRLTASRGTQNSKAARSRSKQLVGCTWRRTQSLKRTVACLTYFVSNFFNFPQGRNVLSKWLNYHWSLWFRGENESRRGRWIQVDSPHSTSSALSNFLFSLCLSGSIIGKCHTWALSHAWFAIGEKAYLVLRSQSSTCLKYSMFSQVAWFSGFCFAGEICENASLGQTLLAISVFSQSNPFRLLQRGVFHSEHTQLMNYDRGISVNTRGLFSGRQG